MARCVTAVQRHVQEVAEALMGSVESSSIVQVASCDRLTTLLQVRVRCACACSSSLSSTRSLDRREPLGWPSPDDNMLPQEAGRLADTQTHTKATSHC
jgi:hypothetical protein